MGTFSNARIGWRDISQEHERPTNPAKGVGDYEGTIGLICDSPGALFVNESAAGYHDWHVREGTQIECCPPYEDECFVGPVWKMSDDVGFVSFPWKADEVIVPCISITGSLRITDIQYST